MCALAKTEGIDIRTGARGMVYNAEIVELITFLETGTRIAQQLR
jgi:hypothetical protein